MALQEESEAVQNYCEDQNWEQVFEIQKSILETYKDDFSKYAKKSDLIRLHRIIDYLGKGSGEKVKYVNIDRDTYPNAIKNALDLLIKSGLLLQAQHSAANGVPLAAESREKIFKIYCLDIGLLIRIAGIQKISSQQFEDVRFVNEGKLAEQFIAQHLQGLSFPQDKKSLYYWLREGRSNNAEIDFLIEHDGKVVPIEVKSGKKGSLKSLIEFINQKKCALSCRFDLNPPSLQSMDFLIHEKNPPSQLISLPLYFVEQTYRIIESVKGV